MIKINPEEYLSLSGIQHFSFCRRQWALIHLEQEWEENILTFKGRDFHEKANDPFFVEKRGEKVISRAVPIVSHQLKLYGVADIIEFQKQDNGIELNGRSGLWWPMPVEYKVGKPKLDNWDKLQLCAQAICLEEMFDLSLQVGAIYYGKTRRRLDVPLDNLLRTETKETVDLMYEVFETGLTPKAEHFSSCERCSLIKVCVPKLQSADKVSSYLNKAMNS